MGSKTGASGGGLGVGDHENGGTDGDLGIPLALIGVGDGDRGWDDTGLRVPAEVVLAVVANCTAAQATWTLHGSGVSLVTPSLGGTPWQYCLAASHVGVTP